MPTASMSRGEITPKKSFNFPLYNEKNEVALRKTSNTTDSNLAVVKNSPNRKKVGKNSSSVPAQNDWKVWAFAALCATSVCFYLIYSILSWKVIYCAVTIIVVGLGLRFYLEFYKTRSVTDVKMTQIEMQREIALIQKQTEITLAQQQLEQNQRELQAAQDRFKLENDKDLFNIQMQADLEKKRIASS